MSLLIESTTAKQPVKGSLGWRILVETGFSAQQQMARDADLAAETLPTARFFLWSPPGVSLGFKQSLPAWFDEERWRRAGLEWVERPTGGGLAFHGSDVSISVIVPRRLQAPLDALMGAVCQSAMALCQSVGVDAHAVIYAPHARRITYCLTQTSPYAVMIAGKKVAGFALRRFPQTWLIQGSLLVRPLADSLRQALPAIVAAKLDEKAAALALAAREAVDESLIARRWAKGWAEWWQEALMEALAKENA